VLEENRTRLQFFQERLEYEADKGASLKHLQEHYAKFLQGVLVEEPVESATEGSTETVADEDTLPNLKGKAKATLKAG
jgi:hypothetical protein